MKVPVDSNTSKWWLRSPGLYDFDAASVGTDGIVHAGRDVASFYGIRPAFWLDLSGA